MRLYSGMSRNFINDTVRNQIAGKRPQFVEITNASPVFTVAC